MGGTGSGRARGSKDQRKRKKRPPASESQKRKKRETEERKKKRKKQLAEETEKQQIERDRPAAAFLEYDQLNTDDIGMFSEDGDNLFATTLEDLDCEQEDESLMKQFAVKVMGQLQDECRTQPHTVNGKLLPVLTNEHKWLVPFLHQNGFWIRKCHVPYIYERLTKKRLKDDHRFYYQDIRVWLPDIQHEGLKVPCHIVVALTKLFAATFQIITQFAVSLDLTLVTGSCLRNISALPVLVNSSWRPRQNP